MPFQSCVILLLVIVASASGCAGRQDPRSLAIENVSDHLVSEVVVTSGDFETRFGDVPSKSLKVYSPPPLYWSQPAILTWLDRTGERHRVERMLDRDKGIPGGRITFFITGRDAELRYEPPAGGP